MSTISDDRSSGAGVVELTLTVNDVERAVSADPSATLLDILRDGLQLTGAKRGCDHGHCGSCTVLLGGRAVYACLVLAIAAQGQAITTIEGISGPDGLHPLQQAFLEHDALQCGYCTPGQIMSLLALLASDIEPTEAAIRRAISGNLCRCGAYPNIVRAGMAAAARMRQGRP